MKLGCAIAGLFLGAVVGFMLGIPSGETDAYAEFSQERIGAGGGGNMMWPLIGGIIGAVLGWMFGRKLDSHRIGGGSRR